MTVSRSTGALLGTNWTTGVTIANNTSTTGSQVDLFGNNTSEGHMRLFLIFTSTTTSGSINITLYPGWASGDNATSQATTISTIPPISGTQQVFLGDFPCGRYMQCNVFNNGTTVSATNVSVLYELFQES